MTINTVGILANGIAAGSASNWAPATTAQVQQILMDPAVLLPINKCITVVTLYGDSPISQGYALWTVNKNRDAFNKVATRILGAGGPY